MEQLIQALTAYTTALEQKLSALEARADRLQLTIDNLQLTVDNLQGTVEKLQAENEALRAEGAGLPTTDPEVEIELIVEGEGVSDMSDLYAETPLELLEKLEVAELESGVELPIVEPVVEPAPVPVVEPAPVLVAEPSPELVVAPEPAPQPVPEVKVEPVVEVKVEKPAPQPATRPMPQQTSLFGAGVEDIRQAISLGDRFLFQRELFAGNGELMQKTLDEINSLGSFSEAMDYVLDNFEWDKESTAVQLFENVLKRRFG